MIEWSRLKYITPKIALIISLLYYEHTKRNILCWKKKIIAIHLLIKIRDNQVIPSITVDSYKTVVLPVFPYQSALDTYK